MKSLNKLKVIEQLGLESAPPAFVAPRTVRRERDPNTKVVLMVDDEPSFLEVSALYFEGTEFELLAATSVAQARELLASRTDCAIILTDMRMPNEDGFCLLKWLRENLRYHHIPAVVLTSCSDDKMVIGAIEAGAQEYIIKPFTKDVLLSRVRRVIDRTRKTVLIVTDFQSTLLVLTRALSTEGFTVLSASDGEQALSIIRESSVDIVLSELALDDMTGFDLMSTSQDVKFGLPFLFLGDPGIRATNSSIVSAGGCALIEKPFNNIEVVRAVQRVRLHHAKA